MIDDNHELTIGELDAVNGGFIKETISMVKEIQSQSPEPPSGGQNDPLSQLFQQVLNSVTQGPG
jgi:hypothetical protein